MRWIRVVALIAKGDKAHSSSRTVGEVEAIFADVNKIWQPAKIGFAASVSELRFDSAVLEGIVDDASKRKSDTDFLVGITGGSANHVTAIYLRSIGGSNGKVFRPKRTVVVVDNTSMPASRTTAHEIGHLFGLEHWLDSPPPAEPDRPPNQLMARTKPGIELTARDLGTVEKALPLAGLGLTHARPRSRKI